MLHKQEEAQVRAAPEGDLRPLVDLYQHQTREACITFDAEPSVPGRRRPWLPSHL